MTTVDLARLTTDLNTATPHQTPPWQDDLPPHILRALLRRAEQLINERRSLRAAMRNR